MKVVARLMSSRYSAWAVLTLPALIMTQGYLRETLFYGELMHLSGDLAAELLILALLVTPLRLLFPNYGWPLWLMRRRRYIGVASFGYALLHALVYAQRLGEIEAIWAQASAVDMFSGWLALAAMLPLALTSNNTSMRLLGRGWKRLHRMAYAAAGLTVLHWYFAAFDPTTGVVYFALLCIVAVFARLWRHRERLR